MASEDDLGTIVTISSRVHPRLAIRATDHFSNVPGYLTRGSAELILLFHLLQREQGVTGDILEIGAFKARSSLFFSTLLGSGETLHVSDLFDRQDLNVSHSIGPGFEAWSRNFERYKLGEPRVIIHHGPSSELDPAGLGSGFRLAYLDGGHATVEVESDLFLAERILGPRGVAIVDDTFFEEFPGTTEGLISYLWRADSRLTPFLCFDQKVALIDQERASSFREEVLGWLDGHEHIRFPDQLLAGRTVAIIRFLNPWEMRSKRIRRYFPGLHALLGRAPMARKVFDRLRGISGRS